MPLQSLSPTLHIRDFTRLATCLIVIALLLGTLALWGANKRALGVFHDDGIYAVVAKSIYQGEGYRIISLPGEPAETKYPFLYSYLLSWVWFLNPNFPQNILALKSLNVLALVGIFFLSLSFYRNNFSALGFGAVIYSILVCTNPIIFTFSDYVISDLLFVGLALSALVISASPPNGSATMPRLVVLGAVVGLACLTRLAAGPLVLAGAAYSFLSQRWRGLLSFMGLVALFVVPWALWVFYKPYPPANSLFAYYAGYDFSGASSVQLSDSLRRHWDVVAGNAEYLLGSFKLLYLTPLLPGLDLVVGALTLAGMAQSLRLKEFFNWSFFLTSTALLLVWPFHPGRYLAPLVPLLILFLFRGMKAVDQWIEAFRGEGVLKSVLAKFGWFPAVLILALTGVWLSGFLMIRSDQSTRGLFGNRLPYSWTGFEESFTWIRTHTPAEALLATAYDPMYYLYTGRRAIRPALHRPSTYFYPYGHPQPNVGSVGEIKPQLDRLKVGYLIIDPLDGYAERDATLRLLDRLVSAYGDKAKQVFTSADGKHRIYALSTD